MTATMASLQASLQWNDLLYHVGVKGGRKRGGRNALERLTPELTIGEYHRRLCELVELGKSHPDSDFEAKTSHPFCGFICGLNDSDFPVDQDFLSDFTEFLLDPEDNPGDCDNWLRGLILDFHCADPSLFASILESKWSDYALETIPGRWVGLGGERQNMVLVKLFTATNRRTPRYAIGVETLLDDGTVDGYQDESEKLKALYAGKKAEVYHCLLTFKRAGNGVRVTEQTYRRLA